VDRAAFDARPAGVALQFYPCVRWLCRLVTISLHRDASLADKDSDAGLVRSRGDGYGIEEESLPCFDTETGCACGLHGADGGNADHGYIEAHVLVGLGYFNHGEGSAEGAGGAAASSREFESAEEFAGAGDGGVGALHGFDGDAGLSGDDDGLAEIVGGNGLGNCASVRDVLLFFFVRGAAGQQACPGEEWFEVGRRGDQFNAFVGQDFGHCPQKHVGVAGAEIEKEFSEAPVGADAGEDLLVLDLACHHGTGDPFGLEGLDQAGELAKGEPMDVNVGVGCGAGVDLWIGFFLDGGYDDCEVVGACRIEQEEREASVASDQA
jgi:hypothetical protein